MEDRITAGLYLEMTDRSPDAYAATRVPEVLAVPDVERATWWENACRDRTDLPRIGPRGSPAWDRWARHPALRIMHVNTFRRLGERLPA